MVKLAVYVGSWICFILLAAVSHAQTFDVSGIRPGMKKEEIISQLTQAFGRGPKNEQQFIARSVNRSEEYRAAIFLSFDQEADRVLDEFMVAFSEMERAVLIVRTAVYPEERRPTIADMTQHVTEKYGPPERPPITYGNSISGAHDYTFMTDPAGSRHSVNLNCFVLHEEMMSSFSSQMSEDSLHNSSFLARLRNSISKPADSFRCGSTLRISVVFRDGRVSEVSQELSDVSAFVGEVLPGFPRPRL